MADFFPSLYTARLNAVVDSRFPMIRVIPGRILDYTPHSRCAGCSKAKGTHEVYGRGWILGEPDPLYYVDKSQLRRYQFHVHYLNWIAHGLYGDGSANPAQDNNVYVNYLGDFPILAASGNTLTLDATAADPRALTLYTYSYPNPTPPPALLNFPVTGCVLPNDVVEFRGDSVLAGRVEAKIVSINVATIDGGGTSYTIDLDQDCSFAKSPSTPGGTTFTARIKRHAYAPEQWLELIDRYDPGWTRLQTRVLVADWPANKIFVLKNSAGANGRVAQYKPAAGGFAATIEISKTVGGVPTTVSPAGLLSIVQTGSATGAGSWVSSMDLTGLIEDATDVTITYYAEAQPGGVKHHLCEGKCHFDKPDWAEVWGVKQEGSPPTRGAGPRGAFYCHRRDGWGGPDGHPTPPTGLANYVPGNCYRTIGDCDGWQLQTSSVSFLSTFAQDIWHSQATKLLQVVPGGATYEIWRVKHPSLDSLAEAWGIDPPDSWYEKVDFPENGGYGQLKALGGAFSDWVRGGPFQIGGVGNGVDWAGGIDAAIFLTTPSPNIGLWGLIGAWTPPARAWTDLSDGLGDAVTAVTDPYNDRNFQKRKPQATQNYTGVVADEGEGHAQTFGPSENLFLSNLDITSGTAVDQSELLWEAGAWTVEGVACSRRITVRAMDRWTNSSRVKVSGVAFGVTDPSPGSNVILLEAELGTHQAGKLAGGGGSDDIAEYDGGGNVVEAPAWARSRNFHELTSYCKWGPTGGKAVTGDVVYFTGVGVPAALVGLGFYVRSVAPNSGTTDGSATPPITFADGIPAGYVDFYNKRDIVALWDDRGFLAANLAGLAGISFEVRTDGRLYPVAANPTRGAITVLHDTYNTAGTDFVSIGASNWICPNRAAGVIYLKTSYVDGLAATPNHCFEVQAVRANRMNFTGEHHVNQVGQALEVLDWIEVAWGSADIVSAQATQGNFPGSFQCYHPVGVNFSVTPWGPNGDEWGRGESRATMGDPVIPGAACGGASFDDVSQLRLSAVDSFNVAILPGAPSSSLVGVVAIEQGVPGANLFLPDLGGETTLPGLAAEIVLESAPRFSALQIARLPKGATILSASFELTFDNFHRKTWTRGGSGNPTQAMYAPIVITSDVTTGSVRAALVGETVDGLFEPIGAGVSVSVVTGVATLIDATAMLTRYLAVRDSDYKTIFLAFLPGDIDVTDLNLGSATWKALLDLATCTFFVTLDGDGNWIDTNHSSSGQYFEFDDVVLSPLRIKFQLPTTGIGNIAREVYAAGNIPKMN